MALARIRFEPIDEHGVPLAPATYSEPYELVEVSERADHVLSGSGNTITVWAAPADGSEVLEIQCDLCGKWVLHAGRSPDQPTQWVCYGSFNANGEMCGRSPRYPKSRPNG